MLSIFFSQHMFLYKETWESNRTPLKIYFKNHMDNFYLINIVKTFIYTEYR